MVNNYIIILYDYDSNTIKPKPLKPSKDDLLQAYTKLYKDSRDRGFIPIIHILYTEASQVVYKIIKIKNVTYN